MPFGAYKHKQHWLLVCALTLIPLVVSGAPTEEDLSQVKQEFNELWNTAEETTKKREQLEQHLKGFETKVALAKKEILTASQQKKSLGQEILKKRELVIVLREQIEAIEQTQAFYLSLVFSQEQSYKKFIRFVASRNITDRETGPAVGGDLLKHVLRGSLGERVDEEMGRLALLKARKKFLAQIQMLSQESNKAEKRIREVAQSLADELATLEKQHAAASELIDEKEDLIDTSWKLRQLTQEEIAHVASEAAEANAMMSAVQSELIRVNEELKNSKKKVLEEELTTLRKNLAIVEEEAAALKRKDEAMRLLQESAKRAEEAGEAAKNTDKKLYKKIEERNFELSRKKDELKTLETEASTEPDAIKAREVLARDIERLQALIGLMKEGIPELEATTIIRTKADSKNAALERKKLGEELKEANVKIASLGTSVSAKVGEIEGVEKAFSSSGLPLFVWPVRGRITAGFFDADYEKVFRVPHRAIDIAAPQSTPVRAITDGVVLAVKDGGAKGYSYVLLGHGNGYASLYGHVSKFLVKTGDVVFTGQVIALSGGRPGTHGAGHMTTGPHLHLEVTKDGKHVNPYNVLSGK